MVEPIEKTSKCAIGPVLLEVSILTFLLGIAMNAIPGLKDHTSGRLIANAASELGVNSVIIGTTKRSALVNLLRGCPFF